MDLKKLIKEYLKDKRVMQLATTANDQPWVCSIHFYMDGDFNFYWVSKTDRRHSEDISANQKVATTILVHEDTPDEPYVVGISAEGIAALLNPEEVKSIAQKFAEKFGKPEEFVKKAIEDTSPHKFYKLTPSKIVLFDNKTFPDDPRKEIIV